MKAPPLSRLVGLETEYAIRFSSDAPHPGNDRIYRAIKEAIADGLATRPGRSAAGRDQFFTENGGAFYYEFLPQCLSGGLIEGATPECRGPTQALLYQRAQEALLQEALPSAQFRLARDHSEGEVGLLKNSRDAEDHVYGSQENYEVDIASGWRLASLRLGMVLLLPVLLVQLVLVLALLIVLTVGALGWFLIAACVPSLRHHVRWLDASEPRDIEQALGKFSLYLSLAIMWPLAIPLCALLRLFAFSRLRRGLLPFLISRTLITGSGSVAEDRQFHLAEKATAVVRVMRWTPLPADRSIFDVGNLLKSFCAPFNGQVAPLLGMFRRRQRLQLGVGDSNRCQLAEFLKVGTTTLVIDMIEDGFLEPPAPLQRPIDALHAVATDPTLRRPLATRDGEMTALELQRFYCQQAREYLQQCQTPSLEAHRVVQLWEETLDHLASGELALLVGQVDWISKRFLLEECGADEDADVLKTLDLRYHELGCGYYERLHGALDEADLVTPEAIHQAKSAPPSDTPAHFRGRLIRDRANSLAPMTISWESARIGPRLKGEIIPFRRPGRG